MKEIKATAPTPQDWMNLIRENEELKKMTEVNWDLAPDGAVELRTDGCICRFFNAEDKMYNYLREWEPHFTPSAWQTVATRPEPSEPHKTVEAYVKEQEGEKWTHIDQCGWRCKILIDDPDSTGHLVLVDEGGEYGLAKYDDLEPIEKPKPIISDEQLSLILDAASAWGVDPDVCQDYLSGVKVEDTGDKCEF